MIEGKPETIYKKAKAKKEVKEVIEEKEET